MGIVAGVVIGVALAAAWLAMLHRNARLLAERRMGAGLALALARWILVIGGFVGLAQGGGPTLVAGIVGFTALRLAATRRIAGEPAPGRHRGDP